MIFKWILYLTVFMAVSLSAWGEPSPGPSLGVPQKKKSRVIKQNERDAEGSQAPNHIQEESIPTSRYRLDGKELEVDPD